MTNATWYRVDGTNFHVNVNADCELIDAMQMRSRKGRAKVIRLRMTTGEQRFDEHGALCVGARGIASIVGAIGASWKNSTGRMIYQRMRDLFPNEPAFRAMLAATYRALTGQSASGEDGYYLGRARAQIGARPFEPVELKARMLCDGVPVDMTVAA